MTKAELQKENDILVEKLSEQIAIATKHAGREVELERVLHKIREILSVFDWCGDYDKYIEWRKKETADLYAEQLKAREETT